MKPLRTLFGIPIITLGEPVPEGPHIEMGQQLKFEQNPDGTYNLVPVPAHEQEPSRN